MRALECPLHRKSPVTGEVLPATYVPIYYVVPGLLARRGRTTSADSGSHASDRFWSPFCW